MARDGLRTPVAGLLERLGDARLVGPELRLAIDDRRLARRQALLAGPPPLLGGGGLLGGGDLLEVGLEVGLPPRELALAVVAPRLGGDELLVARLDLPPQGIEVGAVLGDRRLRP